MAMLSAKTGWKTARSKHQQRTEQKQSKQKKCVRETCSNKKEEKQKLYETEDKKKLWHINQQKASEAAMSAASVAGKWQLQ